MTLKPPGGVGTPLVRSGANDVQAAGARANDASYDSTSVFQGLLNTVNYTVVPPGEYRIDGTLTIGEYRTLELMPGATLVRLSASSASTAPVVRLNGANHSQLIGHGSNSVIQTQNASPDGVVHAGPTVQSVETNVQRWRVRDLCLVGKDATATNIGLNLTSSEATSGGAGAGSNYLGRAEDLEIWQVGVGAKLGALCNAHRFRDINFHLVGDSCYLLAGGASLGQAIGDNSFAGGFTHTKSGSGDITVIKATGYCIFNSFFQVHAEPEASGDPGSKYYDLGADTSQFRILGFGNFETDPQGVDAGTNNVILDENSFKLPGVVIGQAPSSGLGTGWVEVRRSDLPGAEYMMGQNTAGILLLNSKASDIRLRANGNEQLRIGSGTMGFFGTAPAAKPTGVAVTAAAIHAALVSLGLIAA